MMEQRTFLLFAFLLSLFVITLGIRQELKAEHDGGLARHYSPSRTSGKSAAKHVPPPPPEVPKPPVKSCCKTTDYYCSLWGTRSERYCCKKGWLFRRNKCLQWGYRTVKYCCKYTPKYINKCFTGHPKH